MLRLEHKVICMDTNRTIAQAIEAKREAAGLSRRALAQTAGIPYTTFTRKLDKGGLDYTVVEVKSIATALNAPFTELLGDAA